ncbi:MAG: hypothetical protein Q4B15_03310 [Lachnospiraceae bacterium]|nr:hypothetical protein [Lachnospiraceae bacterium]
MQKIMLNLVPRGAQPTAYVSQGDIGRKVAFTVYDGSEILDISEVLSATIGFTKMDGNSYIGEAEISDDEIIYTTELQGTIIAGDYPAKLQLTMSDGLIHTARFIMHVDPRTVDYDQDSSESTISALAEAQKAAYEAVAAYQAAVAEMYEKLEKVGENLASVGTITNNLAQLSVSDTAEEFYPKTIGKAVTLSSGTMLEDALAALQEDIDSKISSVTTGTMFYSKQVTYNIGAVEAGHYIQWTLNSDFPDRDSYTRNFTVYRQNGSGSDTALATMHGTSIEIYPFKDTGDTFSVTIDCKWLRDDVVNKITSEIKTPSDLYVSP